MWVAISGDGLMDYDAMLQELPRDSICPVMTFMEKGKQILPLFPTSEIALKFAELNTPDDYVIAYMEVSHEELEIAKKEGLVLRTIDKPVRKQITVCVLYLNTTVVTQTLGLRSAS